MRPQNNPGIIAIVSFFVLSFTSCLVMDPEPFLIPESRQKQNVYYIPASVNQPLIREKNEFNFSLQRSSSRRHVSADVQGAFMAGKHLGLMAAYSAGKGFSNESMRCQRLEGGLGYIYQINRLLHLESYGGIAGGKIRNVHHTGNSDVRIRSAYIQPTAVIINHNKSVRFAFLSKFSVNKFLVASKNFHVERERFSNNQFLLLQKQPVRLFWQPGITFRFGWKDFLFHSGYCYTSDLSSEDIYRSKGNFSFGFCMVAKAASKKKRSS